MPYLFDEFDRGLQVHTKIDKGPNNALGFVLLLLEYEHKVIEVLLKLFVRKVDAELLEAVELDVRLSGRPRSKCAKHIERHIEKERERRVQIQ